MSASFDYPAMVAYVDGQLRRLEGRLDRVASELDDHQDYHRQLRDRQATDGRASAFSWAQVITSLVLATVALASLIWTLAHGH